MDFYKSIELAKVAVKELQIDLDSVPYTLRDLAQGIQFEICYANRYGLSRELGSAASRAIRNLNDDPYHYRMLTVTSSVVGLQKKLQTQIVIIVLLIILLIYIVHKIRNTGKITKSTSRGKRKKPEESSLNYDSGSNELSSDSSDESM